MRNKLLFAAAIVITGASLLGISKLISQPSDDKKEIRIKECPCSGGNPVDQTTVEKDLALSEVFINASGLRMRNRYFLSRGAINDLLKDDAKTGIWIVPFPEKDSISVLAIPAKIATTEITGGGYPGYVVQTFCPNSCEVTGMPYTK